MDTLVHAAHQRRSDELHDQLQRLVRRHRQQRHPAAARLRNASELSQRRLREAVRRCVSARHDASESRRARRRAQFTGAAVVSGSDDHVAAHRQGCLARRPGRHHRRRVPGPHRAVRAGRERCDRQGGHRTRAHAGARQAGDAPDHQPQPLRSHGGPAAGRCRRADDRAAARQRAAVPRHGGARGAGLIPTIWRARRSRSSSRQ